MTHEFNSAANRRIGAASWWALALSALTLIGAAETAREHYGLALIYALVGLALLRAGLALRTVVTTEGHDIAHFLTAMDAVGHAFLARLLATAIASGIAALWLVYYVVAGLG